MFFNLKSELGYFEVQQRADRCDEGFYPRDRARPSKPDHRRPHHNFELRFPSPFDQSAAGQGDAAYFVAPHPFAILSSWSS